MQGEWKKKINLIGHNKMCAAVLKMPAIATYLEAVQSNHKSTPHLIYDMI